MPGGASLLSRGHTKQEQQQQSVFRRSRVEPNILIDIAAVVAREDDDTYTYDTGMIRGLVPGGQQVEV